MIMSCTYCNSLLGWLPQLAQRRTVARDQLPTTANHHRVAYEYMSDENSSDQRSRQPLKAILPTDCDHRAWNSATSVYHGPNFQELKQRIGAVYNTTTAIFKKNE